MVVSFYHFSDRDGNLPFFLHTAVSSADSRIPHTDTAIPEILHGVL